MQFQHKPISKQVEESLNAVLESWRNTPYRMGLQKKGIGVDCVRFVCAVLDELYGKKTPLDLIPPDTAFHAPELASSAMRKIVRLYEGSIHPRSDDSLEPGDVIVTAPGGHGGPGHAMIAGKWPLLWHSTPAGVVSTGHGTEGLRFVAIVRPPHKETWA